MTRPRIATIQLSEAVSNRPLEPNAAGSSTPPAPSAPAPTVGWANTTLVGCGPVLGLKIPWSGGGVSVAAAGLVAVALGFGPVVAVALALVVAVAVAVAESVAEAEGEPVTIVGVPVGFGRLSGFDPAANTDEPPAAIISASSQHDAISKTTARWMRACWSLPGRRCPGMRV